MTLNYFVHLNVCIFSLTKYEFYNCTRSTHTMKKLKIYICTLINCLRATHKYNIQSIGYLLQYTVVNLTFAFKTQARMHNPKHALEFDLQISSMHNLFSSLLVFNNNVTVLLGLLMLQDKAVMLSKFKVTDQLVFWMLMKYYHFFFSVSGLSHLIQPSLLTVHENITWNNMRLVDGIIRNSLSKFFQPKYF